MAVTVAELIEVLKAFPGDAEIAYPMNDGIRYVKASSVGLMRGFEPRPGLPIDEACDFLGSPIGSQVVVAFDLDPTNLA